MYQSIDVEQYRSQGPHGLHSLTELPRLLLEMTSLAYAWPLLRQSPRGDGHPVLVLPGFTAGDDSTLILRRFLEHQGYRALPWRLGQNTGSVDLQEQLFEHFDTLTQKYDEPISLVGQSLGGVFARELSRRFTPHVRLVVSLGSPFASTGPETTHALVGRLFHYLSGMTPDEMRDHMLAHPASPPPVPATAIYSRSDGVVHWSSCLEHPGDQAENIEVFGSHTGMALNPLVLHVLANRLAQPAGQWRPFRRSRGNRRLFYPRPHRAHGRINTEVTACAN